MNELWGAFPEKPDVFYMHTADFPLVDESALGATTPLSLHVSTLGHHDECSLKPHGGANVVAQLLDQILQDGFMSSNEPLLTTLPPQHTRT